MGFPTDIFLLQNIARATDSALINTSQSETTEARSHATGITIK
jgi:hypothetical protein